MTIPEYRTDKSRANAARQLLKNPVLLEMLTALDESGPLNDLSCLTVTKAEHQDSRLLGFVQGYHAALKALRSLGTLQVPQKEIPQNYPTE